MLAMTAVALICIWCVNSQTWRPKRLALNLPEQDEFMEDFKTPQVSIIIPTYNELQNVPPLYSELRAVLEQTERSFELIFVDDGSTDGTVESLQELAVADSRVKIVLFRRNYGQTAAMQAGIHYAEGDYLVTIDGDLQNDPQDIPMMLAELDQGYDLVHGWRKDRKDALISRKIPSRIANWLISRVTRVPVRDLGCTLKGIRREFADELELCGEMHRFIPILAHQRGAKCAEVVTNHRARRYGTSKYGLSRTIRVVLDLITVKFMLDYFSSPMKLFGRFGWMRKETKPQPIAGRRLARSGSAVFTRALDNDLSALVHLLREKGPSCLLNY